MNDQVYETVKENAHDSGSLETGEISGNNFDSPAPSRSDNLSNIEKLNQYFHF